MNLDKNVFIEGTLVNLRPPNIQKDIIEGSWADWFNDKNITKYLIHGEEHNTKEKQIELVESELAKANILLLSIADKNTGKMLGVISLKDINFKYESCELGIVMGFDTYPRGGAFESMGLLTQYAFEGLNLNSVYAGQHIGHWDCVNKFELLGYRLNGYVKDAQKKYSKFNDIVTMTCLKKTYEHLLVIRNGKYLTDSVIKLYESRRKENMCLKLKKLIDSIYETGTTDF